MPTPPEAGLRIGELSRRVGVSPEVLRAWERRYGLLRPSRTGGGHRMYSDADELRVRRMRELMDRGYGAAVAAELALIPDSGPANAIAVDATLEELRASLRCAIGRYDDAGAHSVLDRLFATYSIDAALREVLLPFLDELGADWESGEINVAQEHFGAGLIQGRLRGLARGWDQGFGPLVVLACPPGERHDIGSLCFGLALRGRGWRLTYLGGDVPVDALEACAADVAPDLVVVSALQREPLVAAAGELAKLAARRPLALGGRGVDDVLARRIGARNLGHDAIAGAELLTEETRAP